jgi:hypothetical protein
MAANMAMPTHAMTRPAFLGPASAKPQAAAPVMMKLSAAPSNARPASRTLTDSRGALTRPSEAR